MSNLVLAPPESPVMQALAIRQADSLSAIDDELAPEYYADEEELEELEDISTRFPLVRFNGKKGTFQEVGHGDNAPDALEGVILSRMEHKSRAWFPPEKDKFWPADKPICRTSSELIPPRLNPDLSPEQKAKALAMGAGKACATCPLARWRGDEPPDCALSEQVLFFDANRQSEVILQVGGTSISPLRAYLGTYKPPRKKQRALYSRVTRLGSADDQAGKNEWKVLTFAAGEYVPSEALGVFRTIKQDALAEIDAMLQRQIDRDKPEAADFELLADPEPALETEGGLQIHPETGELL